MAWVCPWDSRLWGKIVRRRSADWNRRVSTPIRVQVLLRVRKSRVQNHKFFLPCEVKDVISSLPGLTMWQLHAQKHVFNLHVMCTTSFKHPCLLQHSCQAPLKVTSILQRDDLHKPYSPFGIACTAGRSIRVIFAAMQVRSA